jgi:hypothetical protein
VQLLLINYSSAISALLDKTSLTLCQSTLYQITNERGKIAINPDKFDKLITSPRTAVDNDGMLDKETTSYNHIFDAFRLALKFYRFEDSSSD